MTAYCKELMVENIAMSCTLKEAERNLNLKQAYRSYREMATQQADATFRDLESALEQGRGLQSALDTFARMYPTTKQE
jgi:hypothetical protein